MDDDDRNDDNDNVDDDVDADADDDTDDDDDDKRSVERDVFVAATLEEVTANGFKAAPVDDGILLDVDGAPCWTRALGGGGTPKSTAARDTFVMLLPVVALLVVVIPFTNPDSPVFASKA